MPWQSFFRRDDPVILSLLFFYALGVAYTLTWLAQHPGNRDSAIRLVVILTFTQLVLALPPLRRE